MAFKNLFRHVGAIAKVIYITFIVGPVYFPTSQHFEVPLIQNAGFDFDEVLKHQDYQIRFISSKFINLVSSYREWISPLKKRSTNNNLENLKKTAFKSFGAMSPNGNALAMGPS